MLNSRILFLYFFIIIVALCGCSQENTDAGNESAASTIFVNESYQTATDYIISETPIGTDNDLKNWKMVVKMKKGRYYEDKNPGPFSGWRWEGNFLLELADDKDEVISQFSLDKAFGGSDLIFNSKFSIQFDDYNNDGLPDFTIGQYASSDGYEYRMFTIDKDKKITLVPFKGNGVIFCDNSGYSARFEKTDKVTFKVNYYDNSAGKRLTCSYLWDNNEFVKTNSTEIQ